MGSDKVSLADLSAGLIHQHSVHCTVLSVLYSSLICTVGHIASGQKVWTLAVKYHFSSVVDPEGSASFCLIYSRVGNSLIRSDRSNKATVSHSLRSLRTNKRLWANRSGRSCQKSNRERIAQVARQKWANEQISRFLSKSFNCSFFRKKRAIRSENRWVNSQPWSTVDLNLTAHHAFTYMKH